MWIQRFFTLTKTVNKGALNIYVFIGILLIYQMCFCLAYRERKYNNFGEGVQDNHRQQHHDYDGNGGTQKPKPPSEVIIEAVEIPYPVRIGQTIQMKCIWSVGTKNFYSVRWYRNGDQFYAYLNGYEPNLHQRRGIHVNVEDSNEKAITLSNITHESEGEYMCEIMSDGPPFSATKKSANLTVVELPETPQFHGLHHRYMVGDTLNVSCKSENGRPAPTLSLKVNGVPIHEKSGRLIEYNTTTGDRPNVFTSETRLLLPLSENYKPSFTLGCYANSYGLNVQKEVNIQVNQRRFLFYSGNSARGHFGCDRATLNTIGATTLLLIIYK